MFICEEISYWDEMCAEISRFENVWSQIKQILAIFITRKVVGRASET